MRSRRGGATEKSFQDRLQRRRAIAKPIDRVLQGGLSITMNGFVNDFNENTFLTFYEQSKGMCKQDNLQISSSPPFPAPLLKCQNDLDKSEEDCASKQKSDR